MRTPMAMMASKAEVRAEEGEALEADGVAAVDWRVKSVEEADAPRRSPAKGPRREEEPSLALLADWIWEAE
jgi:hypothetical protein